MVDDSINNTTSMLESLLEIYKFVQEPGTPQLQYEGRTLVSLQKSIVN